MNADSTDSGFRRALWTIALVSAALLAFQVLLTRVCALRLHFHFGFLIISNSLLGIGASGSFLALFDRRWRSDPQGWTWGFAAGFVASLPLCWLYLLTAKIPETLHFQSGQEVMQFALFNLACAVPFFFGGTAVGLILSHHAARVNKVYAADLVGAAIGCLMCPLLLWPVGAGGCFLATLLLAILAALAAAPATVGMAARTNLAVLALGCAFFLPRFDADLPVPGKRWLDVTQAHTLTEFGRPVFTQWSANSRIDVLPLPAHTPRFLQARGSAAMAMPIPLQMWIGQDGDAGTMLTNFGGEPEKLDVLKSTMYSASFQVKEGTKPRVFVIGVGGAPDLWAAKAHDASLIRGIELNQAILDLHHTVALPFSKPLLEDPRVELVCDEGRSALMRTDEQFDVIQLTGIDTWTALNSGAYVLAENYLYTVEACRAMYDRLAPGGILQVTRMAAGMETIRLMHNMHAALDPAAQASFADSVAALKTDDYLIAVLLKKGAWTAEERARLDGFADRAGIRKVVLPGREAMASGVDALAATVARLEQPGGDATQLDFEKTRLDVTRFLLATDKQAFTDGYPYDISPTTDDRPYFFSFLRWSDPDAAAANLNKPTWVVQGNPLFLWGQLLASTLAAALLIVLPLCFRRGATQGTREGTGRFLVYFAGLGVGFIGIEVSLIQKFTLLLGQPLHSIVVTLFAILLFTGVGSFWSAHFLRGGMRSAWRIPLLLLAFVGLVALGSQYLVEACIGLPFAIRAAITVAVIAPVALLLGMPFAWGISLVQRTNPSFVPWAWAVNGSMTVVGSIATVILSMNFGFAAVLLISAAVYLVSFGAVGSIARRLDGAAGGA